jgi:hypothetical protein
LGPLPSARRGEPIHLYILWALFLAGCTSKVAMMQRFEAYSLDGAGNRLHDAVEFSLDPMAAALAASVILFAAIPMPAPVCVTQNDLVGMWVTVGGDCSRGQHLLSKNGKYKKWCFDSISEGEWFLTGANKIVLRQDPKTADAEIITVVGFERYSDHTVLDVRYQDGRREKWMK